MTPNTFNEQAQTKEQEEREARKPDYVAMQYRRVPSEEGWKTRKERIGTAYENDNGSICFRPTGQQVINNDVYLFPNELN